MVGVTKQILMLLSFQDGLSDRQLTDAIHGKGAAQQSTNQACRRLERQGFLKRRLKPDGVIGNYVVNSSHASNTITFPTPSEDPFSEDSLKHALQDHFISQGWQVQTAWGKSKGIDIDARLISERRIIEVKGRGSRPQMQVNFFLHVLGEILQKMTDPKAKYSIALPDLPAYRNLWARLPSLAKSKTGISAIFIDMKGKVSEIP